MENLILRLNLNCHLVFFLLKKSKAFSSFFSWKKKEEEEGFYAVEVVKEYECLFRNGRS